MVHTKTILLVDDDEALVNALLRKFSQIPAFAVTVAHNGNEALEMMRSQKFNVVLADLHMPEKNGIEMLQEQNDTLNADTPTYMITNLGSDHYCQEAKDSGAVECFVKSQTTLEEIVAIIKRDVTTPA